MQRLEKILCVCADRVFNERVAETFPEKIYYITQDYEEATTLLASGVIPDLIVVDLLLPGEHTGPETLALLQEQLQPYVVPGVITTANDRLVLYSETRPPELIGIISKSGDEAFLYERLKKLWDEYQGQLESQEERLISS